MERKDLRLGNYLNYDKKLIYISEITRAGIGMYDGYGFDKSSPIECLRPIKLNEEWLLKFGAKRTNEYSFTHSRFKLIWKPNYNYWYVIDLAEKTYLTKIEFVHEYQNFYFVMNGGELIRLASLEKNSGGKLNFNYYGMD